MPFPIVLDTLLRISPEEIGISCGSEQTCRRRVILFNFFPIWTFGGVYIYGYELGAPVFAHLHELLSFKFSKAEMFFSIFNILHRCFYHLMTSVNFFKDRVFATCEWNDWESESLLIKVKLLWLRNNWNLVALLSGEKAQVLQQMVKFYQTAKGEEKSLCWFLRTDACQQHVK